MSVNKGETIRFKIKSATSNYHIDILRLGYYGGDGARLVAPNLAPHRPVDPARLPDQFADTGLIDCGNWAASRVLDGAEHRGLRRLHRASGPQRHRRRQPHHLRRARRRRATPTSWSRPPTRPGRRTTPTAATASTRAPSPARRANPHGYKARVQGLLQPAVHDRRDERRSCAVHGRRVPDDPLPRGATATTSATSAASTRTGAATLLRTTGCSSPAATTSTGRRRSATTSRRARDAGVNLAFFSGNEVLLEDALGAERRRHRARRTARSSPTRTRTSTAAPGPGRVDGHLARPALHDRRRTTSTPENALTGPVVHRQLGHVAHHACPYAYRQLRMWRNTARRDRWPRAEPARWRRDTLGYEWDEDADNGFRPAGPVPALVDDGQPASRCSPTTAARRQFGGPRRTT